MPTPRMLLLYATVIAVNVIVICLSLTLCILIGPRRAYYKMCCMLESVLAWAAKEGRFAYRRAKVESTEGQQHRA